MIPRFRGLVVAISFSLLGVAASAADVALVISNPDALKGRAAQGVEEGHDNLVRLYRDMGFRVTEDENVTRDEFQRLLADFGNAVARGGGKAVIHFSGRAVTIGEDSVLIPADLSATDRTGVLFGGVPLAALTDVAALRPREAAVVLALNVQELDAFKDFASPVFTVRAPDDILVVHGPALAVNEAVSDRFLTRGQSAAEVAAEENRITLAGRVTADMLLVPSSDDARAGLDFAERTLWALASTTNDEVLLRAYLTRFPDGAHAAEARAKLGINPAEEDEAKLKLSADARREIQRDLTVLGYNTRGIDGIFGPGTRGAITAWQKTAGLDETGYLTERQVSLLSKDAAARTRELRAEEQQRRNADNEFWQKNGADGEKAGLRAYLRRYPEGVHAGQAQRKLDQIAKREQGEARKDDREAWLAAQAIDTVPSYRGYLRAFPKGRFRDLAEDRIESLNAANDRQARQSEFAAAEDLLGLNTASLALVEQRLKIVGRNPGPVDGRITPETRTAIRSFQRSQGLEGTGYLNARTVQLLIAASS